MRTTRKSVLARIKRAKDPLQALKALDADERSLLSEMSSREIAEAIGKPDRDRAVRKVIGTPDKRVEDFKRSLSQDLDDLQVSLLQHLQKHRDKRLTYEALSTLFDRSVSSIRAAVVGLAHEGYHVEDLVDAEAITLPRAINNDHIPQPIDFRHSEIIFGVVSDTHLGSRYAALDMLHSAYDLFESEGVEVVFHCGDLTEGPGNRGYQGHANDVLEECQTWRGLEAYASANYPARAGIRTLCISSSKSHDGWTWNKDGRCPTADVCNGRGGTDPLPAREDMIWQGHDSVDVLVGPEERTRIRLHHPDGGSSYALSYPAQKFVEGIPGGTKPHMYFVGHYHQYIATRFRNVEVVLVPGMQWKTPLFRRYGKEPVVGALLVNAHLDTGGSLRSVRVEDLIHYYSDNQPHAA